MKIANPFPLKTWLIAAFVVIVLLGLLSWRSACKAVDTAQDRAEVAQTQANVGQKGAENTAAQVEREATNRETTEANTAHINEADNANDTAGEAGRRGQLAYCERQRVRGKPRPDYCPRL